MLINVTSTQMLGFIIRATRKIQKLRMDDVAGVGPVFVRDVERGKETVQLGRVMKLLDELGIELKVDMPDEAMPSLAALRLSGLKPLPRRRTLKKSNTSAEEVKK